jgi:hypothetical protein
MVTLDGRPAKAVESDVCLFLDEVGPGKHELLRRQD